MVIKKADFEYINKETKEFLNKEFIFNEGNFGGVSLAEENTRVKLIYSPNWNEWIKAMYYVGFTTWNNGFEINLEEIKEEEREKLLVDFIKKRPVSAVLESASFIFKLDNVPRSMTHQIVRARFAAFNQESYRVTPAHHADVRVTKEMGEENIKKIKEKMNDLRQLYVDMIKSGVPTEHARNILPMGTCTHICSMMNLKVLIDYVKARTLDIAQDEHTYIVCLMMQELKVNQPKFFDILKSYIPIIEETMKKYLGDKYF